MKKSLLGAAILGTVGLVSPLTTNVYATEAITTYEGLKTCLESETDTTCTLGGNIEASATMNVKSNIVLELGSYTISAATPFTEGANCVITVVHGGTLTINSEDDGRIDASTNANVYGAIRLTSHVAELQDITKTASVVVNNGTIKG